LLHGPRTNGKLGLLAAAVKHADRQEVVALTGPHDRPRAADERLVQKPALRLTTHAPPRRSHPQPRSLTGRVDQDRLPDPGRPLEAATNLASDCAPGAASSCMPENIGSDYRCEPPPPLPPCTRGRARNRTGSAGARGGRADQRPYPSLDRTRAAVPWLARAREHARTATPRAQHRSHRRRREAGGPTMTTRPTAAGAGKDSR
jgi:hypothetical protein